MRTWRQERVSRSCRNTELDRERTKLLNSRLYITGEFLFCFSLILCDRCKKFLVYLHHQMILSPFSALIFIHTWLLRVIVCFLRAYALSERGLDIFDIKNYTG